MEAVVGAITADPNTAFSNLSAASHKEASVRGKRVILPRRAMESQDIPRLNMPCAAAALRC